MRRARTCLFGALVLLALVGAAATWLIWQRGADVAERAVSWKRWQNVSAHQLGRPLDGTPDFAALDARLALAGLKLGAPLFIRIVKMSFALEVWMLDGDRFRLFTRYPICTFSGRLGPKHAEGDRQSPEGLYTVDRRALNPHSRWHRSFNLGFPNAFDRAHARTGSFLMVHGGCSSIGCYAMTDAGIDEIWRLVTAALDAGQRRIPVMALPFVLTADALAAYGEDPRVDFWRQLAVADAIFTTTGRPPRVRVCAGRYVVTAAAGRDDWEAAIAPECESGAGGGMLRRSSVRRP